MKHHIFLDEWKQNFYNKSFDKAHYLFPTVAVNNSSEDKNSDFLSSIDKVLIQGSQDVSYFPSRFILPDSVHTSRQGKGREGNHEPNLKRLKLTLSRQNNNYFASVHTSRQGKEKQLNPPLNIIQYNLQTYNRSNQDTCMLHRPAVSEGQWVQKGDLLADCSASIGGELALGQNIFVAYMPWEGYNYEDAILISQRLVYDDTYTSIHIERYEIETRETKFGMEEITRQIPEIDKSEIQHLDKRGIIKIGTWVEEGTILVGKVTPTNKKYHSPYQKLLYTILEKEFLPTRDSSLRAPRGLKAKVIDIQVIVTELHSALSSKLVETLDQLKLNRIHKTNAKTTMSQKHYTKQCASYRKWFMFPTLDKNSLNTEKKLKSEIFNKLNKSLRENISLIFQKSEKSNIEVNLKRDLIGSYFPTREGKINNLVSKAESPFPVYLNKSQPYQFIKRKSSGSTLKKTEAVYFSKAGSTQTKYQTLSKKSTSIPINRKSIQAVHIYLAEKRKIQMGDKMAGRHGNKGIVSQVLPRQDMPYLPDGTPIDMVLNPLGVPSRMNVGQIYECLLGLAGKYLGEYFRIAPFDEIYGAEASRSLVYSKLYEVRKKTASKWIFNLNNPGKIYLYDGRTGESFDQAITVGQAYMLKLVHLVDDKIHARSTGPYSLVTQQPLRGRSKQGGQRLGEMEVWALEGYGAAFTLLEMLTIKSDDMTGRITLWSNIILNKEIYIGTPESFKVLVCELQALCLDIGLFRFDSKGFLKQVEHLMKLP